MRSVLLLIAAAGLSLAQAPGPQSPPAGRGQGGPPYAWCDKDKDGKCDFTGRPVGQGPGMAFRGRGAGRGPRGGGCGRCCRQATAPQNPQPANPAAPK